MNIKKGDNVIVIAGKDKGKKGKVTTAIPSLLQVVVEGVNIKKKHQKPKRSGESGQILEIPAAIDISNVMLIDPKTKKPTRVGKKMVGDKYIRIARVSGQEV